MTMHNPSYELGMSNRLEGMELEGHNDRRVIGGYPKTGRTWMRYMLAHSLAKEHRLDIDIDFTNVYSVIPNDEEGRVPGQPSFAYDGEIPMVEMTHKPLSESLRDSDYVFMTRDPRDVLVSHWLHHQKQLNQFDGDLTDFIKSDIGIDHFIDHLETWAPELEQGQIITYESMRIDPRSTLARVALQLSISLSEDSMEYAIAQSEIERMRKKEKERGIAGHRYDRTDPDALRIRRGVVGGFIDYLNPTDEKYIYDRIQLASSRAIGVLALTGYADKAGGRLMED